MSWHPNPLRRQALRGWILVILLPLASQLSLAPSFAQDAAPFKPLRGQSGKDVIWIPTPDALVTRMLQLAQVKAGNFVVDLGAGDGKIVIAAARDFKARGLGLEYDARMVEHARRNAKEAGVSDRAEFRQADIFDTDFSSADVVTMYLLPELNLRLRHTLLAMKPGTRVVSHQFTMGNWQPDEVSWVENRPAYLWIVPANAVGTWRLSYPESGATVTADLTLRQAFQKVRGFVEYPALRTQLRDPAIQGTNIAFSLTDSKGGRRHFAGGIEGDRIRGLVSGPSGDSPFQAQRQGSALPIEGASSASLEELGNAASALDE